MHFMGGGVEDECKSERGSEIGGITKVAEINGGGGGVRQETAKVSGET